MVRILGNYPGQKYQYLQIRYFLNVLLRARNVFRPLMAFEQLVDSGLIKEALSKIYQLLLLKGNVLDWSQKAWGKDIGFELSNSQWGKINWLDHKV